MAVYSNIDLETFNWVTGEVENTLQNAEQELHQYVTSNDKSSLYGVSNELHQVVGSLQMLEMKSVSALMMETEVLVEDFIQEDSQIGKSSFVVLLESSFAALRGSFKRIEKGLPENPIDVVAMINQIRSARGQSDVEISTLFSPMIEVFPEVDSSKALKDDDYKERAVSLRAHFQSFLLQWLRDMDETAIDKIGLVFEKLLQMSAFGSVARLWWVATAYADYVKHNDNDNKTAHSKIFRQLDDLFRKLEEQGESALVRDPGEELVKVMLFYIGVGDKRTERMDKIVDAFKLQEYFPALQLTTESVDFEVIESNVEKLKNRGEVPMPLIRQLVTNYFEEEQSDNEGLVEILDQLEAVSKQADGLEIGIIGEVVDEVSAVVKAIRNGLVPRDEDTGFHLASALIFVENSLNHPEEADADWLQNGQLKLRALSALANQEELSEEMDGAHITGSERQALLDVVGTEVEGNLKEIESKLEEFAADRTNRGLLESIDGQIRQVRGALQVLGEQKVGLLLKMAEEQFTQIASGDSEASPQLVEALAVSIGTMEEYVKGLQLNRKGMDVLLDRSITDLEVAIGKKVSRDDVERLLEDSSGSLFAWLGNQSDFDLFTKLRSTLRDLNILAKKTQLSEVEVLVKEQDRLVDVISQEPAFLTDNITSNLQNNMASITEQIITLYGTEETEEERQLDEEAALKHAAIESDDEDAPRFHDDMDINELGEDIVERDDSLSSTEIAKQHAAEQAEKPQVDEAILEVFLEESEEVLEMANEQYALCREDQNNRDAIRELRRAFHTLKGSSRMVGLDQVGEVAWFSESLFNYVLDTEKPLTSDILDFSRDALDEFQKQVSEGYKNQHLIDADEWGTRTETVNLDVENEVSVEPEVVEPEVAEVVEEEPFEEAPTEHIEMEGEEASEMLIEVVPDEPVAEEPEQEPEIEELVAEESAPEELVDTDVIELADADDDVIEFDTSDVPIELEEPEQEIVELTGESVEEIEPTEPVAEFKVDDLELEDIELEEEQVDVGEDAAETFMSDEELADMIEMNSEGSIIEFASEIGIEDDSVIELDSELLDDAGTELEDIFKTKLDDQQVPGAQAVNDIDVDSVSFSVIDDSEMRDIFAQEVITNVDRVQQELNKAEINVAAEGTLAISIHTLLGNARTLALDVVANAYDSAEQLLMLKQESNNTVSDGEKKLLSELVMLTEGVVNNADEAAPYYQPTEGDWETIQAQLTDALKAEQAIAMPSTGDAGTLSDEDFSELQDIDLTLGEGDDDVSVEPEQVKETDEGADRVASVMDNLDPIDDLVGDSADAASPAEDEDDITEFEASLESFESEASGDDESAVDETAKPLIPEDMADVMEEGIFSFNPGDVTEFEEEPSYSTLDEADAKPEAEETSEADETSETAEETVAAKDVDAETVEAEEVDAPEAASELEPESAESDSTEDEVAAAIESSEEAEGAVTEAADAEEEVVESEQDAPPVLEEVDFEEDESFDSSDELAVELRGIFVEEMRSLHHELDDEVAKLSNMVEMAPAMSNVMRHLHTIKGSALMAEANALGELTHQTESYLESNFIRNEDDLREVRATLEHYVDVLDTATGAYGKGRKFKAPSDLLSRLGVEADSSASAAPKASEPPVREVAPVAPEPEMATITANEVSDLTTSVSAKLDAIQVEWKSVRGWQKAKPKVAKQLDRLLLLVNESEELSDVKPLLSQTINYVDGLKLKRVNEYKDAKAILAEAFDVVVSNMNASVNRKPIDTAERLMEQLSSVEAPKEDKAKPKDEPKKTEATIFVPGSNQPSAEEQAELDRQEEAQRERAAAMRIRTETLDSLTNFVGDVSMNRSQMREDVLSVKSVVDDLYSNMQSFSTQLRELEIEADSKITSRTNEASGVDRGEEFDPLELDRYTKLQQLSRGLAENLDELSNIQTSLSNFIYRAETNLQKQERLNRELQDEIMQVRLVTFGGVGPQLRQVVRRTARELNKDVELEIIGADVRLDKSILDGVIPALEHMLRNAVDHGIETREERKKTKKGKTGKVSVECKQVAREIVISVRDDGKGLDLEKIRKKAIEDNLLAEDQALNPEDVLMYISQSGFSTASKLTQISGRGVGMDVVQATLRRMSGSIAYDIENEQAGSHFMIRLPVSLAVSSAMFVKSGGEAFAISARTIERVVNIEAEELIGYLKADKPIIEVDEVRYSLIDLADYLGYDSKLPILTGKLSVVLVNAGVQNIAVIVEELMDTQEIVVKNLGDHLGRIPIYAGATIRANGSVVLLLDLVGISYYESFVSLPEQNANISHAIPTVMIVDDSLTVRKSAERDISGLGINSLSAKDGLDAQVQLRQEIPDMILLDIEMPRMDGFELLEWVKSEDELKHIPVVMISSRATEKYIDKATKLGCSAFLGKPYLLENLVQVFNQYLKLESPIELDK